MNIGKIDSLNIFCKQLKEGNRKLFDDLFSDYYVNLCRFAYTYVKNSETAEEIVQEMFISIWEQRHELNITTSVRTFLYTSIKNRALNYIRNHKTRANHEDEFANEQASRVSYMVDFCEREELQHLIEQAINELPEQCRIIFEKSREQNLTYKEIAQELNISPKTVENQMSIALKKLRSKLMPYLTAVIAIF
jgi:RNA polymerase sigma-70 factor (ECF subfamily)